MLFQDGSQRVRPRARAHLWAFQQAWLSLRHSTPVNGPSPAAARGSQGRNGPSETLLTPKLVLSLLRFDLKEKAVGRIIKRAESRAAEVWRKRVGSAGLPRGQLKVSC